MAELLPACGCRLQDDELAEVGFPRGDACALQPHLEARPVNAKRRIAASKPIPVSEAAFPAALPGGRRAARPGWPAAGEPARQPAQDLQRLGAAAVWDRDCHRDRNLQPEWDGSLPTCRVRRPAASACTGACSQLHAGCACSSHTASTARQAEHCSPHQQLPLLVLAGPPPSLPTYWAPSRPSRWPSSMASLSRRVSERSQQMGRGWGVGGVVCGRVGGWGTSSCP